MGNFNRDNRFGGRRGYNSRGFGGGRDSGPRQMHKTICSKCGKECEVPFIPTGDRPVFCNDCFDRNRDPGRSNFGEKRFERPNYENRKDSGSNNSQNKEQFEILNVKLDKIVKMLGELIPKTGVSPKMEMKEEILNTEVPIVKKEKKKKVSKKILPVQEIDKKDILTEDL